MLTGGILKHVEEKKMEKYRYVNIWVCIVVCFFPLSFSLSLSFSESRRFLSLLTACCLLSVAFLSVGNHLLYPLLLILLSTATVVADVVAVAVTAAVDMARSCLPCRSCGRFE